MWHIHLRKLRHTSRDAVASQKFSSENCEQGLKKFVILHLVNYFSVYFHLSRIFAKSVKHYQNIKASDVWSEMTDTFQSEHVD